MVIYPGQLAQSVAGRDKNKYFVVLKVEGMYCYISDGRTRKVDAPKKKKLKHLRFTKHSLENVKTKLETGNAVTNLMIRKEIYSIIDNQGC